MMKTTTLILTAALTTSYMLPSAAIEPDPIPAPIQIEKIQEMANKLQTMHQRQMNETQEMANRHMKEANEMSMRHMQESQMMHTQMRGQK